MVTHQQLEVLESQITSFLNINYPCKCSGDDLNDCPGEMYEAHEIVRMMTETLELKVEN